MISKIHFHHYRKLKNISIDLSKNINIISGTNGTCKSSILHIISNSFQAVKSTKCGDAVKKCIEIIKAINEQYNPKLESLTRGDKKYQDPAPGHTGAYYDVEYWGDLATLSFRKHNSQNAGKFRYAVKPTYSAKSNEKLPSLPVIYLGLNRLATYGEYKDLEPIVEIKKNLPQDYLLEIMRIYASFTNYHISNIGVNHMGSVKIRADFDSSEKGIDSNTISAGEDNLYIIISALVSLKYYYDSLAEHREVDSILLIDEFDATLHPAFQFRLFDLVLNYSMAYNIQVVFTSHSLSLIEYCLKKKQNLIYLYDNQTSIHHIENPSIYKINLYLKSITESEYSFERKIPVFSEDEEARYLLNILFNYLSEKHDGFSRVRNYFYLVDANIGGDTLHGLFKDPQLKTFVGQICILDGDHNNDMNNRVITLPGKDSPEKFLINYAQTLYDRDDRFWLSDVVLEENVGKDFYTHTFIPAVEKINEKIESLKSQGKSTSGVMREETKKLFRQHQKFFHIIFDAWLVDNNNVSEINQFYNNLKAMYKKVAPIAGLDPDIWS